MRGRIVVEAMMAEVKVEQSSTGGCVDRVVCSMWGCSTVKTQKRESALGEERNQVVDVFELPGKASV